MSGSVTRPPYPEDTICAQSCCRHPLSEHVEGSRNPFPWLGPEWPRGCNAYMGIGDAGSESCACNMFTPPAFLTFTGDYGQDVAKQLDEWMRDRFWKDKDGRWVVSDDGRIDDALNRIKGTLKSVKERHNINVEIKIERPEKIKPGEEKPHETHSHLVSFLYELMRDHVAVSAVEDIVRQDEELSEGTYLLSDKYLAEKAEELAKRLLRP